MRVLQIRNVVLAHLASHALLLLRADARLGRDVVPLLVLPHVIDAPRADEHELGAQRDRRADGARDVSRRVRRLEDLRAAHVTDAVAQERGRRDDGLLGAAGHVGRDCWRGKSVLWFGKDSKERCGEDLLRVQARKSESTKGTVIRYMPHLIHLFSCVLGRSAIASMPMNGGMVADAMMYMRLFATFLV